MTEQLFTTLEKNGVIRERKSSGGYTISSGEGRELESYWECNVIDGTSDLQLLRLIFTHCGPRQHICDRARRCINEKR